MNIYSGDFQVNSFFDLFMLGPSPSTVFPLDRKTVRYQGDEPAPSRSGRLRQALSGRRAGPRKKPGYLEGLLTGRWLGSNGVPSGSELKNRCPLRTALPAGASGT